MKYRSALYGMSAALALAFVLPATAWQIRKAPGSACVGSYAIAYTKDANQEITAPEVITWVCSPSPSAITEIVIPSAWNGRYARLSANIPSDDGLEIEILKSGSSFLGSPRKIETGSSTYAALSISGAVVPVATGDIFTVNAPSANGTVDAVATEYAWFAAEKKAASFDGALVYKSATQAIAASTDTTLTFDQESYDLNSWHDNVTNNSRLTVPAGVSLVRIQANTITTTTDISSYCQFSFKNGAGAYGLPAGCANMEAPDTASMNLISSILAVSSGDYFTTYVNSNKGGGTTINNGNYTWFQIEAIPAATKYALVRRSSNQAIAAATPTIINWDTEVADTDGWHDNVTNNSRLTVPVGVTKVRLTANVRIGTLIAEAVIRVLKNGAAVSGGLRDGTTTNGVQRNNGASMILDVVAGDYFQLEITHSSGGNIDTSFSSWFSIEEVADPG